MAGGTSGWDSGLRVIGIGCALKVLHVAGNTIRRRAGKLAVYVALGAGDSGVRAGQRELGKGIVIEGCGLPRGGGMAALASLRKSCLHVIRVCRLLEIGEVASHAGCRCARELAPHVTGGAIQYDVRTGQREAGNFQMVKLGAQPGVHAMALLAGGGETSRHMTGACRRLILLGMTGIALRGQSHELSGGRSLVA